MAPIKTVSVTPGTPPCLIVGGPHDGKLTITGITGRTLLLAGHDTEVTMTFHCPDTGPALSTDKINFDPATGIFQFPPPILVVDPCGTTVGDVPSVIRVEHLFKSKSGGPNQTLIEEVPVTVTCPLTACTKTIVLEVEAKAGENQKAAKKAERKATAKAKKQDKKKRGKKKK